MTVNDRQRLKILIILLAVLSTMLWIGQQINQTPAVLPATAVLPASESPGSMNGSSDLSITRDWMESRQRETGDLQRRNPFEYGFKPLQPAPSMSPSETVAGPSPQTVRAAPPPPPIPFQYNGYAVIDREQGQILAFLFDDAKLFSVAEDEVLMGRYRVNQITEAFVEVEDLVFGNSQLLPLVVQ